MPQLLPFKPRNQYPHFRPMPVIQNNAKRLPKRLCENALFSKISELFTTLTKLVMYMPAGYATLWQYCSSSRFNSPLLKNTFCFHTVSEGAAVDEYVVSYAFLRLAIPIKPSRPEPKSQTAAGSGTTATSTFPAEMFVILNLMSAPLPISAGNGI